MNDVVTMKSLGRLAIIEIDSPPVNALSQSVRQGIIENRMHLILAGGLWKLYRPKWG